MFIGHNALAFASKKFVPEVSLGVAFVAVQLPDLLWPFFLLAGVEKVEPTKGETPFLNLDFVSYPYSHSLLGMSVMGVVLGLLWYGLSKARTVRGFFAVLVLVMSHWVLDWATHRPDMPLGFSSGDRYGLGLWSNALLTMVVELVLFGVCLLLYLRSTRAISRAGSWGLWTMVGLLLLIYVANAFSPPPPDWQSVAWMCLAAWVFPLWAWRVDVGRRRR